MSYHTKTRILNDPIPLDELGEYIKGVVSRLPKGAYDMYLTIGESYGYPNVVIEYKLPMTELEIAVYEKSRAQAKLLEYERLKKELGL